MLAPNDGRPILIMKPIILTPQRAHQRLRNPEFQEEQVMGSGADQPAPRLRSPASTTAGSHRVVQFMQIFHLPFYKTPRLGSAVKKKVLIYFYSSKISQNHAMTARPILLLLSLLL